jgi:hypothetical protein
LLYVLSGDDVSVIRDATTGLAQSSMKLGEAIYKATPFDSTAQEGEIVE